MITLYGISNCDKVRKTRNWLAQRNLDYHFHDYKKHGCDRDLATQLLRSFGAKQLINTRGTTWRQLDPAAREPLDEARALALMQQHPALIKRPILKVDESWLLGYDTARMADLVDNQ